MSNELLPCPFCGGEGKIFSAIHGHDEAPVFVPGCARSDCIDGPLFDTEEAAAKWWNTRHEPQPATWIQTPPTVDGFYWVLEDGEKDMIEAFWHAGLRRLVAFRAGNNTWRELSEFYWFCKVDDAPPVPSADDATTARK